jgi:OPA family glycerol-3-phosphate transporter-like MFS transporter
MPVSPLSAFQGIFAPPPPAPRLSAAEVDRVYPWYRWRALEATFVGYAAFYLVRNNIAVVTLEMQGSLNYSKSMIGDIMAATALSYGLSKFLMGSVSDRSNARTFMAAGLFLTALCNFAFGLSSNYHTHLLLWSLNGFVQGMGWPPCGRVMGHWFSESERGLTFSIWNTSHNVGQGIAASLATWAVITFGGGATAFILPGFILSAAAVVTSLNLAAGAAGAMAAWVLTAYGAWRYAFYVPGAIAAIGAVYLLLRLRDTPQSVGLPPIEEYRNDYPPIRDDQMDLERELSFKELFVDKVLLNKYVWLLAIANFFAYITRYSMLDWGPTYLREVKRASLSDGAIALAAIEFAGIPSTILFGWMSDRLKGRRSMVAALCMLPIIGAFGAIIFTPAGYLWFDLLMLMTVGFFIYPVINLIVIAALDIASKKAIGTAAGFIGLFGYIGRTVQAKGFGWTVDEFSKSHGTDAAWLIVLYTILACAAIATILLALMWRVRPRA